MSFESQPAPGLQRPKGRGHRPGWRWVVVGILVVVGLGGISFLNPPRPPLETGDTPAGTAMSELDERVVELLEMASQHGAAGRAEDAEAFLTEAAEVQREINARFPSADGSTARRLEAIDGELQTLQAAPALAEVARLDAVVAGHLRRREPREAAPVIARAWAEMAAITAGFPRVRGVEEDLRRRLEFLNEKQATLGWMQDLAGEGLVGDASRSGQARLETGPGWELYKQVMGPGAGSTAAEQAEFCRRLGWVLGVPVRPALAGAGTARGAFQVVVETGADE